MNIRTLALLLMILTATAGALSQKFIEEKLEPAILEVTYERIKVLDTLDASNDWKKDVLTLTIGQTKSAFYSKSLKVQDSLERRYPDYASERLRDPNRYSIKASLPREVVYKNYPENKIRVMDRYDLCNWIIDEDWEKPEWEIDDSTKVIMDYECVMACANFRGRKWIAWFAADIPIQEGPWKLCGLPGLILEAYDSKHHYTYEATSLKVEHVGFVEYFDYQTLNRFVEKNRRKGLSRKQKYIHEDLQYMVLTSSEYGINKKGVKKRDKIPHTNYDFEETDYPHE